jgi:hypothetical protein
MPRNQFFDVNISALLHSVDMLRAEKNRKEDLVGFRNFADGDQCHPANVTLCANITKMMK